MNVELIHYDANALDLLLFTKETRLKMDAGALAEIATWDEERKLKELNYMRGTIQSSWEFVHYTFAISGVSRAFTHQFVRTRTGSFAQQSQRTVNMTHFDFITPKGIEENESARMDMEEIVTDIDEAYRMMVWGKGVKPEDARAILPTNISTNIVGKFSLRTLHDMALVRLCTRTQGEYQDVFRAMRAAVIKVHPWAEEFIEVACVFNGVCAFPNFEGCPIKGGVFNPETGLRWDRQWRSEYGIPVDERPNTRSEQKASWNGLRTGA